MFHSTMNNLRRVIVALLCVRTVTAVPTALVEVEKISERAVGKIVYPCLNGGPSIALGSPIEAAKNFRFRDAPWFPNCLNIDNREGALKCLGCMAVAGGVYGAAVSGCTAASAACLVGVFECEAVCVAIASYVLWTSEQACYCEHADCSDDAVRDKGKIGGPPELDIAGQHFNLALPKGWGYVGTRSVEVLSLRLNQGAPRCV